MVAEKLQALVQLRMVNARMKDYFDLWLITRQPELKRDVLLAAIRRTFAIVEWGSSMLPSGCHRPLVLTWPNGCSGTHF